MINQCTGTPPIKAQAAVTKEKTTTGNMSSPFLPAHDKHSPDILMTSRMIQQKHTYFDIEDLDPLISKTLDEMNRGDNKGLDFTTQKEVIAVLKTMRECLESYRKNLIPAVYPNLATLYQLEENEELHSLYRQFLKLSNARSCVSLDQQFVHKLADFIKDESVLEVYAGNGWLTYHLKELGVDIKATDLFCGQYDGNPTSNPFLRNVEKKEAVAAVREFLKDLPKDKKGMILIAYPTGGGVRISWILKQILNHNDLKVIIINDMTDLDIPSGVEAEDLMQQLGYQCIDPELEKLYLFRRANS